MEKTAVILAGGSSNRFGQDKGLLQLANKPLIKHVLKAVNSLVDEKLVIVNSQAQAENYKKTLPPEVKVLIDKEEMHSPLAGVLVGFEEASGKHTVLLPCDTPLVSKEILSLLFELCVNRNAAIPRWPNCYLEPLQAVYCTKPALEAAKAALCEGKMNLQSMINKLRGVRYVSTLVLQQLDPELKTFLNINTPLDLRRADALLEHGK